jgi:O-acetyl-ADP-ribose deacetylase (regulator of RNase III)
MKVTQRKSRKELDKELRRELEASLRPELEKKIRKELDAPLRQELEQEIGKELEATIRKELEDKINLELQARKKESLPLPLSKSPAEYELAEAKGRYIGYHTGPISEVQGVDAWVNSENEDMIMDRHIGRTISANIRRLGARVYRDGDWDDTIAETLAQEVSRRPGIRTKDVLVTTAGALEDRKVHRIYHVATVRRGYDKNGGFQAILEDLPACVSEVLNEVEKINARRFVRNRDRSILFPILGAGDGNLQIEEVTPKIIRAAVEFFERRPNSVLQKVYFLAYSERHRRACNETFKALRDEKRLMDPVSEP